MTLALAVVAGPSVVSAQTTYLGANNNVTTFAQMTNAQTAAANFLSVAGNLNTVDFESPTLPAGLTITGGTRTNSNCGALCGINTTAGGAFFRDVVGGLVTFSFASAVDAFGFYVTGLQTDAVAQQTISYINGLGVTRTINMPSATGGGGAFVGFIDFGQQISSVTFNATGDILAFDDLRFGKSVGNPVVPEPSTYALMATGLVGILALRRKRKNA